MKHCIPGWSRLTAAVLIAGVLQGCALIPGTEKRETSGTELPVPVTLKLAQWSVFSARQGEEATGRLRQSHPEFRTELLSIPLDRYTETIHMMLSSGQGPDVFEVVPEWLDSYAHNNYIADIAPEFSRDIAAQLPESVKQYLDHGINAGGHVYALPSGVATCRLLWNKTLFAAAGLSTARPPETLEEMVRAAAAISKSGRGQRCYGFALPLGDGWAGGIQPLELAAGAGGRYFFDFRKGKYDLTGIVPWVRAVQAMEANGGLFPGRESMKSELAMAQFAEGNIGMMLAMSWQAALLADQNPPRFQWGAALPPVAERQTSAGAVPETLTGWFAVWSGTTHPDEAASLWKSLYGPVWKEALVAAGGMMPLSPEATGAAYPEALAAFRLSPDDGLYPATPLRMEEWPRKNTYLAALKQEQPEKILLEEDYRLNALLSRDVESGTLNPGDFTSAHFRPSAPEAFPYR